MEQLKKSDFIALFLSSVFAISTTVSANTCTDAVFKEIAGYYMIEDSGLKLDSVIFNRYLYEFSYILDFNVNMPIIPAVFYGI